MKKSSLELANTKIIDFFSSSPMKVYRRSDLHSIFIKNKYGWELAYSVREALFIDYLINNSILAELRLAFPGRKEIVFVLDKYSIYEIALKVHRDSFFSHITAARLHGLIKGDEKKIYTNSELQRITRGSSSQIDQASLSRAFQNHQRMTNNYAEFNGYLIYRLNSKNHNRLGIKQITTDDGVSLMLTDIERTLVDIVVRPLYADDIYSVLLIYKNAINVCDWGKVLEYLKLMDFSYPYHQSIGFLMEKTGVVSQKVLHVFEKLDKRFDFFLTYQMQNTKYSERWKLYYPADL